MKEGKGDNWGYSRPAGLIMTRTKEREKQEAKRRCQVEGGEENENGVVELNTDKKTGNSLAISNESCNKGSGTSRCYCGRLQASASEVCRARRANMTGLNLIEEEEDDNFDGKVKSEVV